MFIKICTRSNKTSYGIPKKRSPFTEPSINDGGIIVNYIINIKSIKFIVVPFAQT